ncbi:MAG: hypothetical protein DRP26_00565 [Candidatus Zixiibacteriota bacterium]|nr:MAG: hypothetical protein DRP26_00565 [candidate division Zixibacteria bacterium]
MISGIFFTSIEGEKNPLHIIGVSIIELKVTLMIPILLPLLVQMESFFLSGLISGMIQTDIFIQDYISPLIKKKRI